MNKKENEIGIYEQANGIFVCKHQASIALSASEATNNGWLLVSDMLFVVSIHADHKLFSRSSFLNIEIMSLQ